MIEAKAVTKSFDGFLALNDLNMTVPRGSIYGLVGPNGAGKSTILRHLCGVYRPDSGVITVEGQPVYENPAIKERMVVIPDDVYYYGSASVREMMKFYRGMYPTFSMERFEKLAEAFPEVDAKRPIRRMSKGMQKQAAFWLAICCRPELLILDEPVDGLDTVMRRQIMGLILEDVAEHGTTVLVSSHNLRELEDICDHVGIMHSGKMLLERSLSALQDNMVKVQLVAELPLPAELEVVHQSTVGRVQTLIVRGNADTVQPLLAQCHPLLCDILPLSLEEVFIYELGGVDYEVKDILL